MTSEKKRIKELIQIILKSNTSNIGVLDYLLRAVELVKQETKP